MKKLSNTKKTLILTIAGTIITALLFSAVTFAFTKDKNFKPMDGGKGKHMSDDLNKNDNSDNSQDFKGSQNRSQNNGKGPQLGENENIGEIQSIDGTTVVLKVPTEKTENTGDQDNQSKEPQTEEKSFTVTNGIDLSQFTTGDRVKYEVDSNNQITSLEKIEGKSGNRNSKGENSTDNNTDNKTENDQTDPNKTTSL